MILLIFVSIAVYILGVAFSQMMCNMLDVKNTATLIMAFTPIFNLIIPIGLYIFSGQAAKDFFE